MALSILFFLKEKRRSPHIFALFSLAQEASPPKRRKTRETRESCSLALVVVRC
jgi:hypothetical protein